MVVSSSCIKSLSPFQLNRHDAIWFAPEDENPPSISSLFPQLLRGRDRYRLLTVSPACGIFSINGAYCFIRVYPGRYWIRAFPGMTSGWVVSHSNIGRNPGGLPLIIEMLRLLFSTGIATNIPVPITMAQRGAFSRQNHLKALFQYLFPSL